jgi:hypothetical protein
LYRNFTGHSLLLLQFYPPTVFLKDIPLCCYN